MCQPPRMMYGHAPLRSGWSYDTLKAAYLDHRTGKYSEQPPSTESTETLAEAVARRNEEKKL